MKLRLSEDPREWQKFATLLAVVLAAGLVWGWWRWGLPRAGLTAGLAGLAFGLIAVVVRPAWFRGLYRGAMILSFHLGQVLGQVLLVVLFVVLVTPLGWVLRLAGKDLLGLRRAPGAATYWRPAKPGAPFDRMF